MSIVDRVADYLADRLIPTVRFPQTPAPVPPPRTGPAVAPPAADATRQAPAGGGHTPRVDLDRPPGAGRRADNCRYLDDTDHRCTNSYGDPCRPGQDCYPSARAESRRSFLDRHPTWEDRL